MRHLALTRHVALWLVHHYRVFHLEAKPVVNLQVKNEEAKVSIRNSTFSVCRAAEVPTLTLVWEFHVK